VEEEIFWVGRGSEQGLNVRSNNDSDKPLPLPVPAASQSDPVAHSTRIAESRRVRIGIMRASATWITRPCDHLFAADTVAVSACMCVLSLHFAD
jgi:hypothetical protein